VTSSALEVIYFESGDFDQLRTLQQKRIAGIRDAGECWIFCEHDPVITIGKRTTPEELKQARLVSEKYRIPLREVTRGGGVSVHEPGMLMVYPVLDLRARKIGVKRFIESVFDAFSESLADMSEHSAIDFKTCFSKPGLWIVSNGKKLGSVGLRIERGVTNHGFAFNLDNNSKLIEALNPCGIDSGQYSAIAREMNFSIMDRAEVKERFIRALRRNFP